MQTRTYNVYKFEELPVEAQAKALDKYRYFNVEDGFDWWDSIYESWRDKLKEEGYENVKIRFSGFNSQGDGASFTADVDLAKWLESTNNILKWPYLYAQAKEGYAYATVSRSSYPHYVHSNMIDGNVSVDNYSFGEGEETLLELVQKESSEAEVFLTEHARGYSDDIYQDLQDTYDGLVSDEAVKDALIVNEYDFTQEGVIDT